MNRKEDTDIDKQFDLEQHLVTGRDVRNENWNNTGFASQGSRLAQNIKTVANPTKYCFCLMLFIKPVWPTGKRT